MAPDSFARLQTPCQARRSIHCHATTPVAAISQPVCRQQRHHQRRLLFATLPSTKQVVSAAGGLGQSTTGASSFASFWKRLGPHVHESGRPVRARARTRTRLRCDVLRCQSVTLSRMGDSAPGARQNARHETRDAVKTCGERRTVSRRAMPGHSWPTFSSTRSKACRREDDGNLAHSTSFRARSP
jgi:hypothetical protein